MQNCPAHVHPLTGISEIEIQPVHAPMEPILRWSIQMHIRVERKAN